MSAPRSAFRQAPGRHMLHVPSAPSNHSGDQCGRLGARDDAHSALQWWRTRVRVDAPVHAPTHSVMPILAAWIPHRPIHLGTPRAHDASIASITASSETYAHWATTNSNTSTFPPLTRRGSGPSVTFCTPGKPSVQVRAFSASGCAVENLQQPNRSGFVYSPPVQFGPLPCENFAQRSRKVFLIVLTFSTKRLSRPVHGSDTPAVHTRYTPPRAALAPRHTHEQRSSCFHHAHAGAFLLHHNDLILDCLGTWPA